MILEVLKLKFLRKDSQYTIIIIDRLYCWIQWGYKIDYRTKVIKTLIIKLSVIKNKD